MWEHVHIYGGIHLENSVTVNGKKVYSDKKVRSIVGTKINYTDGSWCDVETGQVVNKGRGSISIDVPGEKTDKKKTMKKSYDAKRLRMTELCANIDIQPGTGTQIEVKIEGPSSALKDIDISEDEDLLCIRGKAGKDNKGISVVSASAGRNIIRVGGSISQSICVSDGDIVIGDGCNISGSRISIGGSGSEIETNITVIVPKGTEVDVSEICGSVDIGDTDGKLRASIRGGGKISAGRVKDANLDVQGSGDIRIEEVNGNLTIDPLKGMGSIRVKRGNIETLVARITGMGSIGVGGVAKNATLAVTGMGSINVAKVINRPERHITGMGSIEVGNW